MADDIKIFESTKTGLGSSDTIVLQIDSRARNVEILRVQAYRVSGTATTYQVVIGNATAPSADTLVSKYQSAVVVIATSPNMDSGKISNFCQTDSAGKLYLKPGPIGGSTNNEIKYAVVVKVY